MPDGTVWVLNSVEPYFVGFTPDGQELHAYGSRGGGPREVGAPAGFVEGGLDGDAWVLDRWRLSLIRVAGPEAAWEEVPLPADSLTPGNIVGGRDLTDLRIRTARLGDEVVLARARRSMDDGLLAFWTSIWGADLLAFDPDDGGLRTVVVLGDVLGDPSAHMDLSGGFPPLPLWARLWTACPDGRIRVHDRIGNRVRTFTADGSELEPTPLPPPRYTAVTDMQFARAVLGLVVAERMGEVGEQMSRADSARLLREAASRDLGDPEHLASFLPRYVDLRCGEEGALWLRPFDPEVGGLGGGPTWLRLERGGATREVRLPDRFDAFRFTGDRVWGVLRDEVDVASVAWLPLGRRGTDENEDPETWEQP